jgi:hypothetical protein
MDVDHSFTIEPRAGGGSRLRQDETFRGVLVPFLARSLDRGTLPAFHALDAALKQRAEKVATTRAG